MENSFSIMRKVVQKSGIVIKENARWEGWQLALKCYGYRGKCGFTPYTQAQFK